MVMGHLIVQSVYHHHGQDCTITVGMDGTHSTGSEHYTGVALDYRLHSVPQSIREVIVTKVRESLGPDFDVIWEALGTPQEHLHVEYDPKGAY